MEVLNSVLSFVLQHYLSSFRKPALYYSSVMVISLIASPLFLWCPQAEAQSNKEQCNT